jgi:hypothetical protein
MSEDCDTNGPNECCDAMCKIVAGCTCTHYYIGIHSSQGLGSETPSFRSLCTKPVNLANYTILPTNSFYFQNRALSFNALSGMNGQLRIFESLADTTKFGFIVGY